MGEKIKSFFAWLIGIFFIYSGISYFKQVLVPSIFILISGIAVLPPINKNIKEKMKEKGNYINYEPIRNIIIIILTIIFAVNISESSLIDANKNNSKMNDNIKQFQQSAIDESITKETKETNGIYTGSRSNGKKEGKGKFEWNDGSIYEGEFHEDVINGYGILTIPGKGTYEGTFRNGKKNGQGRYSFINDDIYDGNWVEDKMSGKGTYKFANGDTYIGEFLNNKFNGEGTYTKDNNEYTGTWSNNEYKK